MNDQLLRGDIYYADLNPIYGSEQGGTRPVLILQNNKGNKFSPTTIVAAITSRPKTKSRIPTHCPIPHNEGLEKDSIVLLEQIRTIDKGRLSRYICSLDDDVMKGIDRALAISVDIQNDDKE